LKKLFSLFSMAQQSALTLRNKLLPHKIDHNDVQEQPSLLSAGHGDLHNISGVDQVSLKSDRKSPVESTPQSKIVLTNGSPSIMRVRGSQNLPTYGAGQNMYQLSLPTVGSRPIVHEQRLTQIPIKMPLQGAVPPQMWTSTPQMHSRKFNHFGRHTIIQQGQWMPQQYIVNQTPVSFSAQIPGRVIGQSSIAEQSRYNVSTPLKTSAWLQHSTMNRADPTSPGWTGEQTSDMSSSFVTNINSPNGVYSSVMSTPMLSYISPSGYINSPSNIGTPCLYRTPPPSYTSAERNHGLPSGTTSIDTPPSLDLCNQNPKSLSYPTHVSCNIQLAPLSSIPISNASKKLNSARPNTKLTIHRTSEIAINSITSPLGKSNVYEEDQNDTKRNLEADDNMWDPSFEYIELNKGGRSNLFITWKGQKSNLLAKLRHEKLEVSQCFITTKENVFNVVFQDHKNARKAFTNQLDIHLRMLPPRKSTRKWFRCPSLAFLVKYETKFRLTIRSGRASSSDIVGEFLMTNFGDKKGCYLWADQLKGHRIRVVGARGYLQLPNGRVIYLNYTPNVDGKNKSIGWVSYRSKYTRQDFVIRRSGNILGEYIYKS